MGEREYSVNGNELGKRETIFTSLAVGSFHINSTNDLNHDVTKFDETWLVASFLRFE